MGGSCQERTAIGALHNHFDGYVLACPLTTDDLEYGLLSEYHKAFALLAARVTIAVRANPTAVGTSGRADVRIAPRRLGVDLRWGTRARHD